jgi:hypothetical protein
MVILYGRWALGSGREQAAEMSFATHSLTSAANQATEELLCDLHLGPQRLKPSMETKALSQR